MHSQIEETGTWERKITIGIEPDDIQPEIRKKLKKLRKETNLKGFRKGKTPMSFVKRQYGDRVALEVLSTKVQDSLNAVLGDLNMELIDEPILTESKTPILEEDGDYEADCEFSYLLGLLPTIELSGFQPEDEYTFYQADPPSEVVEEAFENMRKRLGTLVKPEDIEEDDRLEVRLEELDGQEIKEDGVVNTCTLSVDLIGDEKLKEKVKSLHPGDTFDADVYQLEINKDVKYINQYLLDIEQDEESEEEAHKYGPHFRVTINEVNRWVPADLNEEFYEGAFKDAEEKITNKEEACAEIKKQMIADYDALGEQVLLKEVMNRVIEENSIELPKEYLHQRFHNQVQHTHDEGEDLEDYYQDSEKLVIHKVLQHKLDIAVTEAELVEEAESQIGQVFGRYGNLPDDMIRTLVDRRMSDENARNEMANKIYMAKLRKKVRGAVSTKVVPLAPDDLMSKYSAYFPPDEEE